MQSQQELEIEEEEFLFDPQVLAKLKFQQISERKNWQGINV